MPSLFICGRELLLNEKGMQKKEEVTRTKLFAQHDKTCSIGIPVVRGHTPSFLFCYRICHHFCITIVKTFKILPFASSGEPFYF